MKDMHSLRRCVGGRVHSLICKATTMRHPLLQRKKLIAVAILAFALLIVVITLVASSLSVRSNNHITNLFTGARSNSNAGSVPKVKVEPAKSKENGILVTPFRDDASNAVFTNKSKTKFDPAEGAAEDAAILTFSGNVSDFIFSDTGVVR